MFSDYNPLNQDPKELPEIIKAVIHNEKEKLPYLEKLANCDTSLGQFTNQWLLSDLEEPPSEWATNEEMQGFLKIAKVVSRQKKKKWNRNTLLKYARIGQWPTEFNRKSVFSIISGEPRTMEPMLKFIWFKSWSQEFGRPPTSESLWELIENSFSNHRSYFWIEKFILESLEGALKERIIPLPTDFDELKLSQELANWAKIPSHIIKLFDLPEGQIQEERIPKFLDYFIEVRKPENLDVEELQKFAYYDRDSARELGVRRIKLYEPELQNAESWVRGALSMPKLADSWSLNSLSIILISMGIDPLAPKYSKVQAYLLNQLMPYNCNEINSSKPFDQFRIRHKEAFSLPEKEEVPTYEETVEFLGDTLKG